MSVELASLPWFPFEVAASPGCRRTAARIARRAERAYWFLRHTLDVTPRLRLRVLDRAAWPRDDAPQFGVMHDDAAGDLVVGAEPADAWSGISAWLADHLDARTLGMLLRVHGRDLRTRGPALGAIADDLIAHELAHLVAAQSGLQFPRLWLGEAFANYAMVAVLGETDPLGLRRLGSLAQAAETLAGHVPSLRTFEAQFGAMEVMPSVLAQLTLTRGVYETYAAAQAAPLARLFRLFGGGAQVARVPVPDADHELGRMLALHVHPTLADVPTLFPAAPLRAAA